MLPLQARLHGVVPVQKAAFIPMQQSAVAWSNRLKQAFAVCHTLSSVSKSVVAGADTERFLFKAVEARFLVSRGFIADLIASCSHPRIMIGHKAAAS